MRIASLALSLAFAVGSALFTATPADAVASELEAQACAEASSSSTSTASAPGPQPPQPERAEPGPPRPQGSQLAASWPVIATVSSVSIDPRSGLAVSTTLTTRRGPRTPSSAVEPATVAAFRPGGGRLAAPVMQTYTCTFDFQTSQELRTCITGAFCQTQRIHWDRYKVQRVGSGRYVWGYVTFLTEVWWWRSGNAYSLSSQSNNWYMEVFRCDGTTDPKQASGGGWAPAWENDGWSYTYVYPYTTPMSQWPVMWADVQQVYQSRAVMKTDVLESGWYMGTLDNKYIYPKT